MPNGAGLAGRLSSRGAQSPSVTHAEQPHRSRLWSAAGRDKALADVHRRVEEHVMAIGRSGARRTRAAFAQLCGVALALEAIAIPLDCAYAADVNLSQIFDILDADRDGVVGRAEFLRKKTEVFYRALTDLDRDQLLRPNEINLSSAAFADADRNGDGMLSGSEFVQARFMQFDAIDASGDQEITLEEFREFIPQYQR
jgi:Ca2+-binding EF-hand superfamily protein